MCWRCNRSGYNEAPCECICWVDRYPPPTQLRPYPCTHLTPCEHISWVDRYPTPNFHPTPVHIRLLVSKFAGRTAIPTPASTLPLYTSGSLSANLLEGQLSPLQLPPYPYIHRTPCEQMYWMDSYASPQLMHHLTPVHIRLLVSKFVEWTGIPTPNSHSTLVHIKLLVSKCAGWTAIPTPNSRTTLYTSGSW